MLKLLKNKWQPKKLLTNQTFPIFQEEFRRLYMQLEHLKEKNMRFGNRHLTAKIAAMQEAASRQESLKEDVEPGSGDRRRGKGGEGRFNMFSACTAITPAEESSSSGREYALEASDSGTTLPVKSKRLNVTFSPMKGCEGSCAEDTNSSPTANSSQSPTKSVKAVVEAQLEDNRLMKTSSIDNESDPPMSEAKKPQQVDSSSPSNGNVKPGSKGIKSGHARTHAIVINLDDKSRFTEEVTV